MKMDRKILLGIIAGVLPFLLVVPLGFTGRLDGLESTLLDWRYRFVNPAHDHSKEVIILDLDEATLSAYKKDKRFGRWPWKRDVWAPILAYVADGAPRMIFFDIMFTEASPEDDSLADITARIPNLSHALKFRADAEAAPESVPEEIARLAYPVESQGAPFKRYTAMDYPVGRIGGAASSAHSVTLWTDRDGVSRLAEPVFMFEGRAYLSLPLAAYISTLDPGAKISQSPDELFISGTRNGVPEFRRAQLENGRIRMHYYPAWVYESTAKDSLHRISMSGVIDSIRSIEESESKEANIGALNVKVPRDVFQDKIVIVAVSASATFDEKITPYGAGPGYILHATMISNLLGNHFLRRILPFWGFLAAAALMIGTGFFVLQYNQMVVRVIVPLLLFALSIGLILFAFSKDIAFFMIPLPLTFIPGYLGMLGVLSYFEGAEKRRFRGAMAKYLSPDVLEEVMKRGELKAEVGERRHITVLFSDVRSFTTISENMDPAQVVEILNEYFSRMVSIIFENRGTLDKFIGDAIMAFWGAPIARADHAMLAVKSALAMVDSLRDLNAAFVRRGIEPLAMGIGVHTGEMIVGNIGSDQRLDYTLIGDNVNLGSRMEGLTKQYGVEILISESTKAELGGELPARMIDMVAVKGKSIPIAVYEPLSENTYPGISTREVEARSIQAFNHYRNREWEAARALYRELLRARPGGDRTAEMLIRRCDDYEASPPPADWDGSFTMRSK